MAAAKVSTQMYARMHGHAAVACACTGGVEQMLCTLFRMHAPMLCITQRHLVSTVMSGTVTSWPPVERDNSIPVVQELMKEFLEREKRKQAEREAEKAAKSEAPAAEPEKEKASA